MNIAAVHNDNAQNVSIKGDDPQRCLKHCDNGLSVKRLSCLQVDASSVNKYTHDLIYDMDNEQSIRKTEPSTLTPFSLVELSTVSYETDREQSLKESSLRVVSASHTVVNVEDVKDECCICLESYTDENPKVSGSCYHHFHLPCLLSWKQRSNLCPLCCTETLRGIDMVDSSESGSVDDQQRRTANASTRTAEAISADEAYALKLQKAYLRRMLGQARSAGDPTTSRREQTSVVQQPITSTARFQGLWRANHFMPDPPGQHERNNTLMRDCSLQLALTSGSRGTNNRSVRTSRKNENSCCIM